MIVPACAVRFVVAVVQAASRGTNNQHLLSATNHLRGINAAAASTFGDQPYDASASSLSTISSSEEGLALAALAAAHSISTASERGVKFQVLRSALVSAWDIPFSPDAAGCVTADDEGVTKGEGGSDADCCVARSLAVACSVVALAASPATRKTARSTASVLTLSLPPPPPPLKTTTKTAAVGGNAAFHQKLLLAKGCASRALAAALNPPL